MLAVPSPRYLFSVVAVERTARGVYAASVWHNPCNTAEFPERQEVPTMKRPEGRASAPMLVGAKHVPLPEGEGQGEGKETAVPRECFHPEVTDLA